MPGIIVTLLTFPGVIVHEYAHYKMCEWKEIDVQEVVFFQIGSPAGYVLHEEPSEYADALAISGAPFLLNTGLAVGLFLLYGGIAFATGSSDGTGGILGIVLLWLGVSIGMHAIPSSGDAKVLWMQAKKHWRASLLGLLGFPIAALIYVANLLSFLWFDLVYAVLLFFLSIGMLRVVQVV
jgi:hypothetical protein